MEISIPALIAACRSAACSTQPQAAVERLLQGIIGEPSAWADLFAGTDLGADESGVSMLHADEAVTVVHVDLAAGFISRAHDHGLWAVIGVYSGQEDNVFYRADAHGVTPTGTVSVVAPDTIRLGRAAIHHIHNPLSRSLRAIHVYGGDLRTVHRAYWEDGVRFPAGGAKA